MMLKFFQNFLNRIRYAVAVSIAFIRFSGAAVNIRLRYTFASWLLVLRRSVRSVQFFVRRLLSFFARFPAFIPKLYNKKRWEFLKSYSNYRAKRAYFRSFKYAFARFKLLKREQMNFIELFASKKQGLFQYFFAKDWLNWEPGVSLAYRFLIYTRTKTFFQPFWFLFRALVHVFYGKNEPLKSLNRGDFPFEILRHTHLIQYQLNADQLSKRWREPYLETDQNMLYIRHYFPYTWHRPAGYIMHITSDIVGDVFPAGPDFFDVEAYFDFDGEPPFSYEENSWDLGFSVPDRFRTWLNYTTFFGTKKRVVRLMMDYELYQLYVDLEEMLLHMKDPSSASFVGSTGLDEEFAKFKPVEPDLKVSALAIPTVGPFDKPWSSILTKIYPTSYVGFSTVQTFAFIGSQIGLGLVVGLCLVGFIHGYYEAFIGMHAPWVHDINYSRLFFRNHIRPRYYPYFISHYRYWPIVYEGGFWSRLLDYSYWGYLQGRVVSLILLVGAVIFVGVPPEEGPPRPGRMMRMPLYYVKIFLPWMIDKYKLPSGFTNLTVYKIVRQNDDMYWANFYLPITGLEAESWLSYLLSFSMVPFYYIIDFYSAYPLFLLLSLVPLLFIVTKIIIFRFFPSTFEGAAFYMALSSSLGSIIPYAKAEFRALDIRTNPLTAVEMKLDDQSSSATSSLMRFQVMGIVEELRLFYDYFIHLDTRELLSFKYDYLGAGRENSYATELRGLNPYVNWIGWYSPTEEDEAMDADFEFLTEEADDEEDDSDDPGTDTDYEMSYGMTSFHHGVRAPIYSIYWKARERSYYNQVLQLPVIRAFSVYRNLMTKDFLKVLQLATSSSSDFRIFFSVLATQTDRSLVVLPPDVLRGILRYTSFRRLTRQFYNLQLRDDDLFDIRLFEIYDVVLPTMEFPNYRSDTSDLIITYNSVSFARRGGFVASLLSFAWYKAWMAFFFYPELNLYLHVVKMHIRQHPSVFANEPTLRDLPQEMHENEIEFFQVIDEDLDEVIVDTTAYPLDFMEEDSDLDTDMDLHNWFENAITLRLGFSSSVVTYALPFMFYKDYDGKQRLSYSLNDFYWASNTMKTWLPIVPDENIAFIQYLLFSKLVTPMACLVNGFYAIQLECDEAMHVGKPSEVVFAGSLHPTYNLYSVDQMEMVGGWPYGLGNNALDLGVIESVMKRTGSRDRDVIDSINFTSADLQHFPHLSYEQRMYLSLDWKMRQFMNLYVETDLSNPDPADIEILDPFAFRSWLSEPSIWIIFPSGYTYDSMW